MSATKLSSQNVAPTAFDAAFTTMVKLDGVMIARGGRLLFRNVYFDVKPGTVMQLTGANGTGKTSLLRVIAGALPPAGGELTHKDSLTIAYLPADDMLWQGTRDVRASLRDWAPDATSPLSCDHRIDIENRHDMGCKLLGQLFMTGDNNGTTGTHMLCHQVARGRKARIIKTIEGLVEQPQIGLLQQQARP